MNARSLASPISRGLSALLLCAIPMLISLGVVHLFLKANLDEYCPKGGDPLEYWHEVATFQTVGLHGGHYGFEDTAAPASRFGIGTFGFHSQWFPILYGSVAKITGWKPSTGIKFNIVAVTLAIGIMLLLMRGSASFHLFCGLFFITSAYIFGCLVSFSMEALYYALSIVISGLFYRLSAGNNGSRGGIKIYLCVAIFVAALMRYSFGLLFIAFFLISDKPNSLRSFLLSLGKGLGSVLIPMLLYMFFSAPYPYEPFPGSTWGPKVYVAMLSGDFVPFVNLVKTNFGGLFLPEKITAYHLLCWEILLFVVLAPLLTFKKNHDTLLEKDAARSMAIFHVVTLGLPALSCLFYYYFALGMTGLRVCMPFFVCSMILLGRSINWRWLFPVLSLNVALFPAVILDIQRNYFNEYDSYQADMGGWEVGNIFGKVAFQAGASSPWCNTVLLFGVYEIDQMLFVPPEFAVNSMRLPEHFDKARGLNAKYVATNSALAGEQLDGDSNFSKLSTNGRWTLYINNKFSCGDTTNNN